MSAAEGGGVGVCIKPGVGVGSSVTTGVSPLVTGMDGSALMVNQANNTSPNKMITAISIPFFIPASLCWKVSIYWILQ